MPEYLLQKITQVPCVKEENMGVEVYEKLRQHLDRLPLGAPKTAEGVEIEFFKCLFTEEEAELATQLTPMPEDEYFSKAKETTGSIKTAAGSYNVTDFSVMSLPNETIRVRIKFSVGKTF